MAAAQNAILRAGKGIHLDGVPAPAAIQEQTIPAAQQAQPAPHEPTEEERELMRAAQAAILRAAGTQEGERITSRRTKKLPETDATQGIKEAGAGAEKKADRVRIDPKTGRTIKEKRIGRLTFEFVQPDKKSAIQKKNDTGREEKRPVPDWEEFSRQEPASKGSDGVSRRTKKTASVEKQAPSRKKAPSKATKKRGGVEDDTGFFDD